MGDAALLSVDVRPSKLLGRDVLVGHLLHDLGPGEKHVGRVAHHDHDIGDGRRVHGAAGARAEDERDLRHLTRRQDIFEKDVGVAGEGVHALLDAGAAGIVEPDDGRPGVDRHLHDLADLFGIGRGQGTAEDREILGEDEDQPAADGPVTGDHAVGVGLLSIHPEFGAAVGDEGVVFLEAAVVEDVFETLPRRVLPLGVLGGDALFAAALPRLFAFVCKIEELAFDAHDASGALIAPRGVNVRRTDS